MSTSDEQTPTPSEAESHGGSPAGESQPGGEAARDDHHPSTSGSGTGEKAVSAGAVWSVLGTLLSGLLVWGGIGWLVDRWLGTVLAFPIGMVLGMIGSFYLIHKRFGES